MEYFFRLYISFLFNQKVLVTKQDLYHEETCKELIETITELLHLNIIPIINTNDAVTGIVTPVGVDESDGTKL